MPKNIRYGREADRGLDLWVKLARAYAVMNKVAGKNIRQHGLTLPQFGVLECLYHIGPMPIGDLSRKLLVSGGNMTCVVDNLEKEGLVRRVPYPEDARSVIVESTVEGDKLIKRIFPEHAGRIALAASVLSPEEQKELSRLLKKLGTGISD
ncbi:MAG: winged helix-turn-helix transcriptional regulator [Bacteroidetes bacterium]|nr:winged helix-turn-helix transcriptional regulator [Bacteroidota bacterium]